MPILPITAKKNYIYFANLYKVLDTQGNNLAKINTSTKNLQYTLEIHFLKYF